MQPKRFLCGLMAALTLTGGLPQAAALTDLSPWATEAVQAAAAGLEPGALTWAPAAEPVTRAEFASIALTLFESLAGYTIPRSRSVWFTDCTDADVNTAYEQGLVAGKGDGTFSPDATITRQDLCVMLRSVLTQVGASADGDPDMLNGYSDSEQISYYARAAVSAMLENGILLGSNGRLDPKGTASREQALILAYRLFTDYRLYFDEPAAGDAYGAIVIPSFDTTSHADLTYEVIEPAVQTFSPVVVIPLDPNSTLDPLYNDEADEIAVKDEDEDDADLTEWDELAEELSAMSDAEKKVFIFGEDNEPYEDEDDARDNQATITFPVWKLTEDGDKYQSTATITLHASLADLVVQIFTEIFESDEQFPIANVGAFSWRSNTRSEHRQGTAIDINWESNMEATIEDDGSLTITSGDHWEPCDDPLSIPADSDIVRIFKKYGFSWGGDAWTSKVDYMHFSFFGH